MTPVVRPIHRKTTFLLPGRVGIGWRNEAKPFEVDRFRVPKRDYMCGQQKMELISTIEAETKKNGERKRRYQHLRSKCAFVRLYDRR